MKYLTRIPDLEKCFGIAVLTALGVFTGMRCCSSFLLNQAVKQNDPQTISFVAKWDKSALSQFGVDLESPLTRAVHLNSKDAYVALLENCVSPNRIAFGGHTLMNLVASQDDPTWLRLAIRNGGNPNIDNFATPLRRTIPIIASIQSDNIECLQVLVDECNVDIHQIIDSQDALVAAALAGKHNAVLYLLKAGANFQRKTGQHMSFATAICKYKVQDYLHESNKKELQAVIDWLKEQGVEYDKPKRDGDAWVY